MTLRVMRDNGHWHIRGTFMSERVRRTTGLRATQKTKPMAEKMRVQLERAIADAAFGVPVVTETFGEAAREYLLWKKVEGNNDMRQENKLMKMCDYFGAMPLNEINDGVVAAYITTHWTHLTPSAVRRYLNDFIAVLNYAERRIKAFTAPKITRPAANDMRTVHLEAEEANGLLDWMREHNEYFYPHFVAMIDTGVRMQELVAITSRSFSLAKQVTMIRKAHTGAKTKTLARDVPMTDAMKEIAVAAQGLPAHIPVFQGYTGPWHNPSSASGALGKHLKQACKALGLPYKGSEAIRCHDLRHTFAYLTASGGADLGDLQYLMGHADVTQTMRYRGFIQSRARTFVTNLRGQSAAA